MIKIKNNNVKPRGGWRSLTGLLMFSIGFANSFANADVGELLWEENFNSLKSDVWNIDVGDGCAQGICGWGNQELQWYAEENVYIENIPGEAGNSALVLEAKNQNVGNKAFTSGKVQTSNKVAVQYGLIEVRIQVPDVDQGLWPAAWMLGTSTLNWPSKGEIDMMEMGHSAVAREMAGFPGAAINNFVGSNMIFYADAACTLENPSCAASTAWQTDHAHVSSTPMNDRFAIYRTYWTNEQVRFTIEENGVEIDIYEAPILIGEEMTEFQAPFYMLLNLAVGGTFTDSQNNGSVSAPLPAKMLIDYIRVYKLDGQGEVFIGNVIEPETGTFGVFTDNTPTSDKLIPGVSSDIFVWNQNSIGEGNIAPFEGEEVIAWQYTSPNQWFGAGIQTRQARDMSNFAEGVMKFRIKIPANVAFKVGIADTYTNENWLTFPAFETTYGLVRDGEWAQATIPISDLRGDLIALQSIKNHFNILSVDGQFPAASFQFAIDDIVWEGGGEDPDVIDTDGDGVNDDIDECPATPANTEVDAVGCPIPVDTDGDGVPDNIDLCPNTEPGTVVDSNGCKILVTPNVTVQAEDYNDFYDSTVGNNGGVYRNDNVDIENTTDTGGGYNIGWTAAGEWLEYSVELGVGNYFITSRVASAIGNASYSVSIDGNLVSGDSVNNTGGWQSFESHSLGQFNVSTSGNHVLRVDMTGGEFNLNWINLTLEVVADSDGDGVSDDIDECPGTPTGTEVDSVGCPVPVDLDSDNDGVNDDIDECPNTPVGTEVDSVGCPIPVIVDSDGDGVNDDIDECPATPPNTEVDAVGCPVSTEVTGLNQISQTSVTFFVKSSAWADVHYKINNAGQQNFRMAFNGEQNVKTIEGLLSGDVINYWFTYLADDGAVIDSTLQTYTMGTVNNDSDNDGVTNDIDECPGTPANTPVDAVGCPIPTPIEDEDNDGVGDDIDLCPGTPAGVSVGPDGCPLPVQETEVAAANERLVGGVDSSKPGFTLYVFDNDRGSSGSNCNGSCANLWPPLLVTDNVASGVAGLSTITRNDGSLQVAHNNRPLYFYLGDTAAGDTNGQAMRNVWWTVDYGSLGDITPLYNEQTVLEQAISFDRGDALVTRFADRGRDRHAKEDQFQVYDHYLSLYWKHRTARFQFEDYVAKGGTTIDVTFISEWKLGAREFRAWYRGLGTVAEYHGNYQSDPDWPVAEEGPGTWDNNFVKTSDQGVQYKYTTKIIQYKGLNWNPTEPVTPLQNGQKMEIEVSQFLDGQPDGRANYYGTTYLYIVGQGMVPWKTVGDFSDPSSLREDSYPIDESGWLGGGTTLPYNYTNEPDNHFMQMATNLSHINGQAFVLGRRLFHTDFITGQHDESIENGFFNEMTGKAGTHLVNASCSGCHVRNGRAVPVAEGVPLEKWVFKVGDSDGNPDKKVGRVLQPKNVGIDNGSLGEGNVSIQFWTEANGLRSPNYQFDSAWFEGDQNEGGMPAQFSARIAPPLIGLGLLEAIPESSILALEDVEDANNDGISGKAQRVLDPVTAKTRLGRFGWKAGTSSVKHQIAGALNTDMGVMTSVLPSPDCGSEQQACGNNGVELTDNHLDDLVKYVALLGVRAQRDLDNADVIKGKDIFTNIGCAGCHTGTFQTSQFHPMSELRNQTIHPYSDLLLHDMGAGLADSLAEGLASGAEWRTTPLWGIGLSACVSGGVTNPGGQGNEVCDAKHSYLHDGRARSIQEAILWHGGESQASNNAYQNLSATDKTALLSFLNSL